MSTKKRSEKRHRAVLLATRVTPPERDRIAAEAQARGLTVSAFLRHCALEFAR